MTSPRETACQALFSLVSAAYPWGNTPTRRLKMIEDVPQVQRPAFYQSEHGPDSYVWSNTFKPKRTMTVSLFFYTYSTDANPGAPQLNAISDAVDAALQPSGADLAMGRLTGSGSAFQFRIKNIPIRTPGDLDGDGLMVIEVEIILP